MHYLSVVEVLTDRLGSIPASVAFSQTLGEKLVVWGRVERWERPTFNKRWTGRLEADGMGRSLIVPDDDGHLYLLLYLIYLYNIRVLYSVNIYIFEINLFKWAIQYKIELGIPSKLKQRVWHAVFAYNDSFSFNKCYNSLATVWPKAVKHCLQFLFILLKKALFMISILTIFCTTFISSKTVTKLNTNILDFYITVNLITMKWSLPHRNISQYDYWFWLKDKIIILTRHIVFCQAIAIFYLNYHRLLLFLNSCLNIFSKVSDKGFGK